MATFSAREGTKLASFETADRSVRYTLRSDGKVLIQFRSDGKLRAPVIAGWQLKPGFRNVDAFTRACTRRHATERVI